MIGLLALLAANFGWPCTMSAVASCPARAYSVRLIGLDVPPPGAGVNTVTGAANGPPAGTSAAEMDAFSCLLLRKVVGRSLPFQRTREPGTKGAPFTVKVKSWLPSATLEGLMDVSVGTPYGTGTSYSSARLLSGSATYRLPWGSSATS